MLAFRRVPEDPSGPGLPVPDIPLIDRPRSAPAPPPLVRPPLAVRKRVLVVDDEAPIRGLVQRILSTENYEILCAESGEEALRMMAAPGTPSIDLLVTDLMMPGMTGRELAAIVRSRNPAVRVLYQTGFVDTLFNGSAELGEGESFLEKPFGAEGLLQAVRLVMFGHITDGPAPPDLRDAKPSWVEGLRAKVLRFLQGPEPKRRKRRRVAPP